MELNISGWAFKVLGWQSTYNTLAINVQPISWTLFFEAFNK